MRILGLTLAFAVVACSSGSSSSSASSGPAAACADMADAVAKAAVRCGQTYQPNYDSFVKVAAKGSCSNIVSVRDEAALRSTCIPSISTISCTDLAAGKLDATCLAQLQHPAAIAPGLIHIGSAGEAAAGPSLD